MDLLEYVDFPPMYMHGDFVNIRQGQTDLEYELKCQPMKKKTSNDVRR